MILRVRDGAYLVLKRNPLKLRYEIVASHHGISDRILWVSANLRIKNKQIGEEKLRELQTIFKADPTLMVSEMSASTLGNP